MKKLINFFGTKKDEKKTSVTCPSCGGSGCDFCNNSGNVSSEKAKRFKK